MKRNDESSQVLKSVNREISIIAKDESISKSQASLVWFATNILDLSQMDAVEAVSIDGSNDKGIDLFWIDHEEERIILAQGKYSLKGKTRIKLADIGKLDSGMKWLKAPNALKDEGRQDLADAADEFQKYLEKGYAIDLWFVFNVNTRVDIESQKNVYNNSYNRNNLNCELRICSLELMSSTWKTLNGIDQSIPKETITFNNGQKFEFTGAFGEAFVTSLSESEIIRLYKKYGEDLFGQNVRYYLKPKNKSVNKGLLETLSDSKAKNNFWAYNNGITILCSDFKVANDSITISDFSIVNGCQTTETIAKHSIETPDTEAYVLTRIIAANNDVANNIIKFTNSQNPIYSWDLASREPTQRRLKSDFDNLKSPYCYKTKRGDKSIEDTDKYGKGRNRRQINIDIMGQYATAFRGNPVRAYMSKAVIFSDYHDYAFPKNVRVLDVLFQWICGSICHKITKDEKVNAKKEDNKDDYRILKRGATFFVLAIMSEILQLRNGPNYMTKLTEERILSRTSSKRLEQYAHYSTLNYIATMNDMIEAQGEEVMSLVRSSDFFRHLLKRAISKYKRDAINKSWIDNALPLISK